MLPWIIVKPETLLFYRYDLKIFLAKHHYQIISVKFIDNWDILSLRLYKSSNKVQRPQLELQNLGRKQIFGDNGNYAEVWMLQSDYDETLNTHMRRLNQLKYFFRSMYWPHGLTIRFELNNVSTSYHFSYFHVSDPVGKIIQGEWLLIEEFMK